MANSGELNLNNVMLDDVKMDRAKIGSGTYVFVYKARYKNKIFAAKEFFHSDATVSFDDGFDSEGNPKNPVAEKLLKECQQCIRLRHPNVVRLLGLHYSAPAVPVLIVEKLRETLKCFLDKNKDVEFACKFSILLDVAQGLKYLHSQDPQVSRGYLTSKDVLLTDQRQAKIAGDSKVSSSLEKVSLRKSQNNDKADFLPYGVKLDTCELDLSLEVFSYGGIMLHVLTQMWPKPERSDRSISEIYQRIKYIDAVSDHRLQGLIKYCLNNNSKERPKIIQVYATLQDIADEETSLTVVTEFKTTIKQESQANETIKEGTKIEKTLAQKDQMINDLIKQKKQLIQQKDKEIQQKVVEIQEITKAKNEEINQLNIALDKVRHQQNEVSHEQERKIRLKQKESRNKETQTEIVDEMIQQQSHEQVIKSQRANDQQPKDIPLLPASEMCFVEKLPEFVTSNKSVFFFVTLRNIEGHPITNGARNISIKATNAVTKYPTSLQINCNENENGQYVLLFTIRDTGEYKLQICFDGRKIIDNSFRVHCLPNLQQDPAGEDGMRIIKPLQNATATSCYFNSVLQVLNQTTGFVKMMLKYGGKEKRLYMVSYKNDKQNVDMKYLPIELTGVDIHTLLNTLKVFLEQLELDENVAMRPDFVLHRLTENSSFKHQRHGQHSQEDSHELLRYLLYELKKEEINLIKKEVQNILESNIGDLQSDESRKTALKNSLRAAAKLITPIEEVFGGIKLNTVICRECNTPLQTYEPFFDISLGLPDLRQGRGFNSEHIWESHRQTNRNRVNSSWQQWSTGTNQHISSPTSPTNKYGMAAPYYVEYDKKSIQALLKSRENFFYQPICDRAVPNPNGVEAALAEHVDVDNMDENNKFICNECTKKKGTTADGSPRLCFVTKQILIHQIPQTLILHFKRFNIDTFVVTKESKHVSFSPLLNMAPYCSNKCLKDFGDKDGNILYGLYGVVEHKGTMLQSGHYIAYVRKRPERQESIPANYSSWKYDRETAHDGKWFYTSDLTVSECRWKFEEVKNCSAYMLFYELLPKKYVGSYKKSHAYKKGKGQTKDKGHSKLCKRSRKGYGKKPWKGVKKYPCHLA